MVEDPQSHQGLHHIRVKLGEADVQVQQSLFEEQVNRQPEPLEEVVLVHDHMTGERLSWLVEWHEESKLHIIKDLIKFPD